MKYFEDKTGLHGVAVLPAGVDELTEAEYTARLEEIRRIAAQRAAEAEAAETAEKEAATDDN